MLDKTFPWHGGTLDKTYSWHRGCWTEPIPGTGCVEQDLIWDSVVKSVKQGVFRVKNQFPKLIECSSHFICMVQDKQNAK